MESHEYGKTRVLSRVLGKEYNGANSSDEATVVHDTREECQRGGSMGGFVEESCPVCVDGSWIGKCYMRLPSPRGLGDDAKRRDFCG